MSQKIYLYDVYKNTVKTFADGNELVKFLVRSTNQLPFSSILSNRFFDNINVTGNDKTADGFLKQYIFFDDSKRHIDIRYLKESVYDQCRSIYSAYHKRNRLENVEYGDMCENKFGKFRYRIDPVPSVFGTHRRYCGIRHIKTTAEIRDQANLEYRKYLRAKRKNIPTVYDDIPRNVQRSWKEQTKCKKQYMKNRTEH